MAELSVLDRFSRNLFHDKPGSFVFKALALALAQFALAAGLDLQMQSEQRVFSYMPYAHSESASVHNEALRLFSDLGIESRLGFKLPHKAITDQFGRFQHRNTTINRPSTAADLAFLRQPESRF